MYLLPPIGASILVIHLNFSLFLLPPKCRRQMSIHPRMSPRRKASTYFSSALHRASPSPLTASASAFTPSAAQALSPNSQASTPPPQQPAANLPDSPLTRVTSPPVTITQQALNAPIFVPRTAVAVAAGVGASTRKAAMSPPPSFNRREFSDEFHG